MKNILFKTVQILLIQISFLGLAYAESVQVKDDEAALLFQHLESSGLRIVEDTQTQFLHVEVMMCSTYYSGGPGPQFARCLLPNEQVRVENEKAIAVIEILKRYNMPTDQKFTQAGLDCTRSLLGAKASACFLTPRIYE